MNMMGDNDLSDLFEEQPEFVDTNFGGPASPDDLFSIFESLDAELTRLDGPQKQSLSSVFHESETELEFETVLASPSRCKKPKLNSGSAPTDGQQRVSHITVERNRRKQMNEHLTVLRKLMPCFYVKRGDQASIIGGVIDYINELQQILQSLESKKQRKAYTEGVLSPSPVMSPRPAGMTPTSIMSPRLVMAPSPRPSPLSPRAKPPLSPRLPISPRTPQPTSPYKPRLQQQQLPSPSPTSSSGPTSNDSVANELAANSKSDIADVEVKLSGANLLLKTVSPRIPGQVTKIISTLEELSLEILQVNISSVDDTVVNSFTIKIGIECHLSADELAHQIQQTFQP